MNELLGHTITDVEISEHERAIRFRTSDDKIFVYETEGDCCSESWFSEILNLDFMINHTVTEVLQLAMPSPVDDFNDGHCRQEYDAFYGYRIATEAGHCTIVFRNSSNGYYGGSCSYRPDSSGDEFTTTDYFGTGSSQRSLGWQSIKHLADWTAYEDRKGSYFSFLKLKAFW